MSIHISADSIQGKQRKEIIKEIKQKAKEAALYAIKEVLEAGLEAEVEHQLVNVGIKWAGSYPLIGERASRSGSG